MKPDSKEDEAWDLFSAASPAELAYALAAVEAAVKAMGGTLTGDVQMTLDIRPSVTFTLSFSGNDLRNYIALHPIREAAAAIGREDIQDTASRTGRQDI